MLERESGISQIVDLVIYSSFHEEAPTCISAEAGTRFMAATDYLKPHLRKLQGRSSPESLVEYLLKKELYAPQSWEAYVMEQYIRADPFGLLAPEPEPMPQNEDDPTETEDPGLLSDLVKFRTNIRSTNWEYVRRERAVKLNWGVCAMDGIDLRLSVPCYVFQPLYPHQAAGIERIYQNFDNGKRGLLLADEMGLGKFPCFRVFDAFEPHSFFLLPTFRQDASGFGQQPITSMVRKVQTKLIFGPSCTDDDVEG